jgi:hypothetical protein
MVAKVESAQGSQRWQNWRTPSQAIAKKIATLVPKVEDDTEVQVVLHLAEAYANLAIEPPRTRAH